MTHRQTRNPVYPTIPFPAGHTSTAGAEALYTPLTLAQATHFLRRIGARATPDAARTLEGQMATDVVATFIAEAQNRPLPDPPEWHDTPPPVNEGEAAIQAYLQENRAWLRSYREAWLAEIFVGGLREEMALFWHNHFVTESRKYRLAPFAYQYVTLLRTHALGNFRTLVHDIGLTPAMLIYLDGNRSHRRAPNENYARELLELFTMGIGNYTQEDIQEMARALTGWVVDYATLSPRFVPARHDDGEKTIFGRTGRFGYEDVVALIFEERGRAVAEFICRKLYRHFVYVEPDEGIVQALADTFEANDYELAPVLHQLLSSAHFFDSNWQGAQIKSPVAYLRALFGELNHLPEDPRGYTFLARVLSLLNQTLLDPPNVAGWPGHHDWITTTTLPLRWLTASIVLSGRQYLGTPDVVALAEATSAPQDPYQLAIELAEAFIAVPLPEDIRNTLPEALLAGTPDYEWNIYTPGARERLHQYLNYLAQLPEFQLT